MNINTIYYNEDLTIKSQTTQPIRAFAEQANTIEIYAPVSTHNAAYFILQGLKNGVTNPRLLPTERLVMGYIDQVTVGGVVYSHWSARIPGAVLNDMSLMKCTGLRFLTEFWYLGDEVLGVRQYNTEVVLDIVAFLEADFPSALDGDYVRVLDTDTDWVFDDVNGWEDYLSQHIAYVTKDPTSTADFGLEAGISTGDPSHTPSSTELIIQEIVNNNTAMTAAKVSVSAVVGTTSEETAGGDKDTPIYSKLKSDEVLAAEIAKVLDGTTPITDLDVNGNADISGNLTVHGTTGLSSLTIGGDGLDMDQTKITDMADGVLDTDGATKGQMDAADALRPTLAGNNVLTGQNQFQGDTYFLPTSNPLSIGVKIDKTNAAVEILYNGYVYAKLNKDGAYLNPTYVTSVGENNTPTKAMVDAYIATHNGTVEANTAHAYIRALVAALTSRVDGLTSRGDPYGVVDELTATLAALSASARDIVINASIVAGVGGAEYTPTGGDVVYDKGIGDDVDYHVWQYNGTTSHWVDEGQESVSAASDSVAGIVKGGMESATASLLKYTEIIGGEIHNLLADKTFGVYDETTGLLHYTYEEIKAVEDRVAVLEANDIVQDADIDQAQADIVTLNANIGTLDDANLNESHSRMSPALLGDIVDGTPVSDAYWNGRLNEIRLNGLTVAQLIKNGNFINTANWTATSGTFTVTGNVGSFTATAQNGTLKQAITLISGHVYHIKVTASVASNAVSFYLNDGSTDFATVSHSASAGYETLSVIGTAGASGSYYFYIKDARASGWTAILLKNISVIDLTLANTAPDGIHYHDKTASQVSAYLGDYDTTAEIVAKAIAGGQTNKVSNGEFATDTTGWLANNSTNVWLTGGYLQNTADGTSIFGQTYNLISYNPVISTTLYVVARVRVTNTLCTKLSFILRDGGGTPLYEVDIQLNPTQNTWYNISYVFNVGETFTENTRLYVKQSYANTTNATNAVMEVDYVRMYDITDYYRTAGLQSFSPLTITSTDGTITRSLDLSGIGYLNSLPSGAKDEYDTYVSASTGERVHELTLRAARIALPTGAGYWSLGKVGTTHTRFFIRLEDIYTAETIAPFVTQTYRANLPTSSGWSAMSVGASYTLFRIALPAGLETWAIDTAATILANTPLTVVAYNTIADGSDAAIGTGLALNVDSTYLYVGLPNATADTIGELYTYLAANPIGVVIPLDGDGAGTEDAYTLPSAQVSLFTHIADTASVTLYEDADNDMHYFSIKLPNTTADTLAELYTYLLANPITVVVPLTEVVETTVIGYLKQTGAAMTIDVTSSTFVNESAFAVKYVKDLQVVIDAGETEDLRFPVTVLKQGATSKPDFDYTNIGLLFPQNDATEIVYIVAQLPHKRVPDSDIIPHVHCRLAGAGQPVMKMDYKWYNPSATAIPSSFTTYTMNVNTATWSTGTISNKIYGAAAIDGTGKTDSSVLIIKLYRDDNAYTGDLLVDEFDIHYSKTF